MGSEFIIHLLTTVTTILQILPETVFSNSTLAKRVAPHTCGGYSTSIQV